MTEDLSFIKNGTDWLVNITHENETYIRTDSKEELDAIYKIKGLLLIRKKTTPLGELIKMLHENIIGLKSLFRILIIEIPM
ncbi:hypothetical protein [Serpentinicella alkaliphila]|uniref:hypothetical protein n=1 Tax=Serpentinicella alkaliphila TaxID=1734049 RepID=UPI001A9C21C1|nr:hypothetical protein [Serpentinicella alkaliphila]QUH24478.1 hypothetical protein HZR23_00805 [Serpentinicella alkaliphila]